MALIANLELDQGSDFLVSFDLVRKFNDPINLDGYTGEAKMKPQKETQWYFFFEVSIFENRVTLKIEHDISRRIPPGQYVYDVELTSIDGLKTRIVQGNILVTGEITTNG